MPPRAPSLPKRAQLPYVLAAFVLLALAHVAAPAAGQQSFTAAPGYRTPVSSCCTQELIDIAAAESSVPYRPYTFAAGDAAGVCCAIEVRVAYK